MQYKYLIIIILLFSIQTLAQNKNDTIVSLEEVTVQGNSKKNVQMSAPQSVVQVSQTFLKQHFSGSLMQTLEQIPGIKAMSIGSGQSKPVIRGLGFNRMLVAENGVKHEAQQWGDDHGLEIDQFSLDNVEIVKGAGALYYGSDAVAGVINLKNSYIPQKTVEGEINLFGRTNNESIGLAGKIGGRKNRVWYKANFTLIDYADYKIPTDSIQYYSYYIKLKNRRLRNTAGNEYNGGLHLGYLGDNFITNFYISDVYAKSGFFADAHGLEVRLSDIDYDRNRRDINLPYHAVNHFKATNHTAILLDKMSIEGDFAYQNNFRQEFAEPISHGYMPIPPSSLERQYNKNTLTANVCLKMEIAEKHHFHAGFNGEYQHNRRAGWGFIIPDFNTSSAGIFLYDKWNITDNLNISGGVRGDYIYTKIAEYRDWYKTPDENGNEKYKIRSESLKRRFTALTYSLGMNYAVGDWVLKANAGKSFRAPIPKELGSDGVNYHIFRYEKGNPNLKPEESYQFDAGVSWTVGAGRALPLLEITVEPFVNFFPNYIYLNPTSDYYEGLQMYYYTQSRVFRWGLEINFNCKIIKQLELNLSGDYLYARQLSGDKKGYTLPFSPPASATFEIKYLPHAKWSGKDGFISVDCRAVAPQNEIVPPENTTTGYTLFNAAAGRTFAFNEKTLQVRALRATPLRATPLRMRISLQANNLLNRRYYDHTSFYRLIDVPEAGRNFSIMLNFNF
jgi:iron complex outermembrane receptor protein